MRRGPEHDPGPWEVCDLVRREISRDSAYACVTRLLRRDGTVADAEFSGELGISLSAAKSDCCSRHELNRGLENSSWQLGAGNADGGHE